MHKCVPTLYRSIPFGFFNIERKTSGYRAADCDIVYSPYYAQRCAGSGLSVPREPIPGGLFFVLVLVDRLLQGDGGHLSGR